MQTRSLACRATSSSRGAGSSPRRCARRAGVRRPRQVAALRKPSVAAWAVNQLVRTQRSSVQELFDAGDALRDAQSDLLAGQGDGRTLRAAGERERAAVEDLVERARGLLSSAGDELSPAVIERVADTLHAAALDEDGSRSGARRPVRARAAPRRTRARPRRERAVRAGAASPAGAAGAGARRAGRRAGGAGRLRKPPARAARARPPPQRAPRRSRSASRPTTRRGGRRRAGGRRAARRRSVRKAAR